MSERKPYKSWQAVLATSAVVALSLSTLIAVGAFAGYLTHRSGTKTVEVVRYVTVANSSNAPPSSLPLSGVPPVSSSRSSSTPAGSSEAPAR